MWQMYAIFEEVVGTQPDSTLSGQSEDDIGENGEPTSTFMTPSSLPVDQDNTVVTPKPQEDAKEEIPRQSPRHGPQFGSPRIVRKRMSSSRHHHSHYYTHRHSSSLPHPRRHQRTKSEPSSNPLLDTISVLTYDPCDSDDYYDLTSVYEQRRMLSRSDEKARTSSTSQQHHGHGIDGDRDSIGYAGSNSIDSGYKSLCPTPEIPDSSIYGAEGARGPPSTSSSTWTDSSSSTSSPGRNRESGKPKIMMGTKVMGRQGQVTTPRDSQIGTPGSRRSDSSLYDVNLDHLMYLRQSLLSAIQRCESSSPSQEGNTNYPGRASFLGRSGLIKPKRRDTATRGSCESEVCVSTIGSNCTQEMSTTTTNASSTSLSSSSSPSPPSSSSGSPSYQKTVRFDTDVKVSSLGNAKKHTSSSDVGSVSNNVTNPSINVNSTSSNSKTPHTGKMQSKSILKDPLCANLRSQLESGATDCTLEEEIDSLLYGRAEFYDLESVDDFPCSYVTMIEEKYRCGKPSLAKVRKLKGNKSQESTKAVAGSDYPASNASSVEEKDADGLHQQNQKEGASLSASKSLGSSAKCRFTEVARCMLEIIEDLQLKKLHLDVGKGSKDGVQQPPCNRTSSSSSPSLVAPEIKEREAKKVTAEDVVQSGDAPDDLVSNASSSACYTPAVEYHVYEEIAYDFVGNAIDGQQSTKVVDVPPPLPARPSVMLQKMEQQSQRFSTSSSTSSAAPVAPDSLDRCSKKPLQPPQEGSVRNRPKQRSNLYSLFADQAERRNISRSLEREWRVASDHGDPEDEYGFRKVFPSI